MKTIALVDPFYGGHHEIYLKLFSKALSALGFRVMVFTLRPNEMEEMVKEDSEIDCSTIRFFSIPELVNRDSLFYSFWGLTTGARRWRAMRKSIKEASSATGWSPDMVFIAWLDSYLNFFAGRRIVDLLFPYDWSGLYFHPLRLRVPESSSLPEAINLYGALRSVRCKTVAVLDEGVVGKLKKCLGGKRVVAFPDVADASPPDSNYSVLREIRDKARGRKIITIIGSLEKRKGILSLLEVAKSNAMENFFFVFAGKLKDKTFKNEELELIRENAERPSDNCFFHLASISGESRFNALMEATEIVYASYDGFYHSSNILAKAAIFKKPLIVTDGFCMGERVREFGIGLTVDYGDVSQCRDAIRALSESKDRGKLALDFEGYLSLHSPSRLSESFSDLIDTRLN
ncbi:MAG: glycosyltransferase [Thermodesulfobacteriota bacterium]